MQGHLLRLGVKVTRVSLRTSIHNVDHDNTVSRRPNTIKRRIIFTVPHPNALWHVDGNQKSIQLKFVVHAGVDGFSRMIVFMNCSNNKSETALEGSKRSFFIWIMSSLDMLILCFPYRQ